MPSLHQQHHHQQQQQHKVRSGERVLRYLQVLELVDLLMHGLPGAVVGLLNVQVVAVDRGAPVESRRVPQDHQGRVAHLQHVEAKRRPWRRGQKGQHLSAGAV